jgi:MraZ protein
MGGMFQGAALLQLDAKGRMTVPARHRDALTADGGGKLTLTRHPEGCLMLFAQPQWLLFRDKVAALPMSAQWWKRVFLGNAVEVEVDSGGRVLISPELRDEAGLQKEVRLVGMGTHFELWDAALYAQRQGEAMQQPLPEPLQNWSF